MNLRLRKKQLCPVSHPYLLPNHLTTCSKFGKGLYRHELFFFQKSLKGKSIKDSTFLKLKHLVKNGN